MLAPEILANSIAQFFSRKLSLRLDNGSLPMYPMRLDWIQPRALDRQSLSKYSHPAFSLHSLVVLLDPSAHFLTLVSGGIVPNKRQHSLAFFSQLPTDPIKKVGRDLAYGATIYKSQQQIACVAPQQPIAAQCKRIGVGLALFKLMQLQRLRISPGMKSWLMKPAPPRLIFEAQDPIAVSGRESFQSFKLLFFNAYCGSGLVIQFLARFHFTPSLEIALRITSRLTGLLTSPCSKTTSAANQQISGPHWHFDALKGAAEEAEELRKLLRGAYVLTGVEATRQQSSIFPGRTYFTLPPTASSCQIFDSSWQCYRGRS